MLFSRGSVVKVWGCSFHKNILLCQTDTTLWGCYTPGCGSDVVLESLRRDSSAGSVLRSTCRGDDWGSDGLCLCDEHEDAPCSRSDKVGVGCSRTGWWKLLWLLPSVVWNSSDRFLWIWPTLIETHTHHCIITSLICRHGGADLRPAHNTVWTYFSELETVFMC